MVKHSLIEVLYVFIRSSLMQDPMKIQQLVKIHIQNIQASASLTKY